ncbi:hypothetical protein GOP47_0027695, partial [Adiantum capillus-veneris]
VEEMQGGKDVLGLTSTVSDTVLGSLPSDVLHPIGSNAEAANTVLGNLTNSYISVTVHNYI